jgi:hypothetical protein
VHPGREPPPAGRDEHVELEREAATGRAGRPEQVRDPVAALRGAHDARRQVQQPGEVGQVELAGRDLGGAGQHVDDRRLSGRQVAGQRDARQIPGVCRICVAVSTATILDAPAILTP